MSGVTVAEGPAPTAEKSQVKNKVCLIVHDGWGIAAKEGIDGNAIEAGTTANMDTIAKEHSFRSIRAHGTAVGLNEGLMGNSEVGHLNIGAGRVVWQDIVRIDVSIKKKTFHKNPTILEACKRAKEGSGRLHLLGLRSFGRRPPTVASTHTSNTSLLSSKPPKNKASHRPTSTFSATYMSNSRPRRRFLVFQRLIISHTLHVKNNQDRLSLHGWSLRAPTNIQAHVFEPLTSANFKPSISRLSVDMRLDYLVVTPSQCRPMS